MTPLLDLELLRTFVAIVEGGGFTRAGERLHKSQSTVSQQVGRLERRLEAALLERTTRGVALTERGELLLGYARRLLALNEEAAAALAAPRLEGRVRLGAAQEIADGGLAEVLAHFTRLYPGVRLEVRVDANRRLREAVADGSLDLAVLFQERGSGGEVVGQLERVWVAAHGFRPPPGEPLPLVLFDAPCLFRDAALAALEGAGMSWRIALTTPSLSGARAAVRAGLGVGVRTSQWVEESLQILGDGMPPLPPIELALHRRAEADGEAAERLRQSVLAALESGRP